MLGRVIKSSLSVQNKLRPFAKKLGEVVTKKNYVVLFCVVYQNIPQLDLDRSAQSKQILFLLAKGILLPQ